MSYTYLQELGEESLAECFADIPASALLKLTPSAVASYFSGSETESFQGFQYGTMPGPSTEAHGQRESILSRRASRATISHRRAKRLASMDRNLPSSLRFYESAIRFDPNTSSWKTAGILWEEDLPESLVNLPGWGMLQGGCVLGPVTSEPTTKGFGLGLFPTPMTGSDKWNGTFQEGGGSFNKWRETWLGVQLINPGLWEEIMDWPIGWTDSQPLEQAKFQQWLRSHGIS